MADYWHKIWACPYFVWDTREKIGCEGSRVVRFPSADSLNNYAKRFCTDIEGCHKCVIAAKLDRKYEGEK